MNNTEFKKNVGEVLKQEGFLYKNKQYYFENEDLTDIFSMHPIDYDEMKGPYYFVLTLQTHDYSMWKRYRIEADFNSDNSLSYYNVMAQHTIWE